jgi:two-component system sensor histidine kinase CreC
MRDALEGRKYVENYVQALTHEIKSPVAAISGAAELLREEMPAAQRDRFLGNIQAETIRIQQIVDRLLLLSAVEAKKTLEERTPIDLAEVLKEAIGSVEPQAAGKKIAMETDFPEDACTTEGDRFLLEKALSNLLQNAVVFTPEKGRISTSLSREDGCYIIAIEDNGPGVPEFAQPRVFERFFSLPRPDTGKKSSGLGLAFVQEVATLHGGSVTLENVESGGARATLRLPVLVGSKNRVTV